MVPSSEEIRLKSSPHRSVSLRRSASGEAKVVKRYHSRGSWRGFWDGARARREFRMLERLNTLGVEVPQPLSCGKRGGVWEVATRWIPSTKTLGEFLHPLADAPSSPRRMAEGLGSSLGKAHALGLEHGDLHAGNLLVEESGGAWIIDVPKARVRAPLPVRNLRRDLTRLNGEVREFVSLALRRRFWVAWREAFEAAGGQRTSEIEALAELAELAGAGERRSALLRHQDRWCRESGLCERREYEGRRILAARHALAQAWLASPRVGAVIDRDPDTFEESWRELGCAWQHGLPTLIPLYILQGESAEAAYLPPSVAREMGFELRMDARPLTRALAERELELENKDSLWMPKRGEGVLGPTSRLIRREER